MENVRSLTSRHTNNDAYISAETELPFRLSEHLLKVLYKFENNIKILL